MQFLLLVHPNREVMAGLDDQARADNTERHRAVAARMRERNMLIAAGKLYEPEETVQVRRGADDRVVVVDGPYAETKEQFGGFYIIDCRDFDEACALAAEIPTARYGTIEIRRIHD